MARILISGATGFVGSPLSLFLKSQNHQVVTLVRATEQKDRDSIVWDPLNRIAESKEFEGFDVVIHLAGEPLTLSRWSSEKQKKILESRTKSTEFLTSLLVNAKIAPKLFLSASAFGFYGDRGDEVLTEESGVGNGFLAEVCSLWEKASMPLVERGVRVAHARFGMVLGARGGALKKMLLPYKLGLGGPLGDGMQWVSWIALEDLIEAINFVIQTESLNGPVNFVSPNSVRQAEFSSLLAQVLHRPHFFSTPAWVLKFIYGIAAKELLLSSAKVMPAKLIAANFSFKYPDLRSALCKALQIT
ncbi:MAG: TIGR01777 family protein [Chlamydiae bacterium CG10_big_fil_rev_8_21_14_0_10_42_34]|nr:MAG: TIGR01777 family protein [Chlamydiae bacterium CG10_big_fil_rev_8_21_14_0_10_42_34]